MNPNDDLFERASTEYEGGDFKKAFSLFLNAAEGGSVDAMERLASMYGAGEGTGLDFEKSIYWDKKAVDNGSILSLLNLGITYRSVGDIRLSKSWFEKALAAGDGEAALQLAKLYMVSEKEAGIVVGLLNAAIDSKTLCDASLEEASKFLTEYSRS